jgi:ribonuclease HI
MQTTLTPSSKLLFLLSSSFRTREPCINTLDRLSHTHRHTILPFRPHINTATIRISFLFVSSWAGRQQPNLILGYAHDFPDKSSPSPAPCSGGMPCCLAFYRLLTTILLILILPSRALSFNKMAKEKYYAVAVGRTTGIFTSWSECEKQVKGFKKARFKSFSHIVEAQDFLRRNSLASTKADDGQETGGFSQKQSPIKSSLSPPSSSSSSQIEESSNRSSRINNNNKNSSSNNNNNNNNSNEQEAEEEEGSNSSRSSKRSDSALFANTMTGIMTGKTDDKAVPGAYDDYDGSTISEVEGRGEDRDNEAERSSRSAHVPAEVPTAVSTVSGSSRSSSHNNNSNVSSNKRAREDATVEGAVYSFTNIHAVRRARPASSTQVMTYKVVLHFDGGSRGNPGLSGCGAVLAIQVNTDTLESPFRRVLYVRHYLGTSSTNNEAEYSGLICGLKMLHHEILRVQASLPKDIDLYLTVRGDSNLIIQQLKQEYKVNSEKLKPLYRKARHLIADLKNLENTVMRKLSFAHVYRKDNSIADRKYTVCAVLYIVFMWRVVLRCACVYKVCARMCRDHVTAASNGTKSSILLILYFSLCFLCLPHLSRLPAVVPDRISKRGDG